MTRPPRIDRPSVGLKRTPPEKAKRKVGDHGKFVRTLGCLAASSGPCRGRVVAAHVRAGLPADAQKGGMALKPGRPWIVPLCEGHHDEQHGTGEITFYARLGIDPVPVCERLWRVSGDTEQGLRAIERARQSARLKQGVE